MDVSLDRFSSLEFSSTASGCISDIETVNNVIAEYGICTVYSELLYGTVRVYTEKREKIIYPALGFGL